LRAIAKSPRELQDSFELVGPAAYEWLAGGNRQHAPVDGNRQDAIALGIRVRHRRGDGAEIDLQRVDVLVRHAELRGQPLDEVVEAQCPARRPLRANPLLGDELERMVEALRARTPDLGGIGLRDQAVGDHELQDVVEAQAAIGRRGARTARQGPCLAGLVFGYWRCHAARLYTVVRAICGAFHAGRWRHCPRGP
jgi:hypothetical protein